MFKLEIFVPEDFALKIISGLSEIGAARLGNYDHTAAITHVKGHWRPLEGADPFDGEIGKLSTADEAKIETICKSELLEEAVKVIKVFTPMRSH